MTERKRDRLMVGLRRGGRATVVVSGWLGDRLLDVAMWGVNLVRDLPVRIGRLATTLWQGLRGVA
ncbi:MAG: hypothetical protein N2439_01315, partial [Anaerolineae bacterium]|nr:hypothetical protein [Anaerolineae bacterium]